MTEICIVELQGVKALNESCIYSVRYGADLFIGEATVTFGYKV